MAKNIQEYLNNTYDRNVKEIEFDSDELELSKKGALVISDYLELEIVKATGSEDVNNITRITISNCPKLKVMNIIDFVDNEQLAINNCPNLEILKCENNKLLAIKGLNKCLKLTELQCRENQLTNLDLINCEKLTEIGCGENQLNQLTLPNLDNLRKLYCWENNLTNLDFLEKLNTEKLERLSLGDNNFPKEDLTIFTKFRELKELRIAGTSKPSYFYGSLEPLQELKSLKVLDIRGTNITHGLEYLPKSVKNFYCTPMRPDAKIIDIYEELQPFGEDINKWREVKMEKKDYLSLASLIPSQLINEIKPENKVWENNGVPNLDYEVIHLNSWGELKLFSTSLLPTKLYNIEEDWIENFSTKEVVDVETREIKEGVEPNTNVKHYAILSYVWGDPKIKTHRKIKEKMEGKEGLTILGNKVLYKAINACKCEELKEIKHVWLDQLCIDRSNNNEKAQEVSKMRQYYSNATVTLISINTELGDLSNVDLIGILKLIVNSQWFTRSWTFQEGWLSKHTIFMFDDKLIDGRAMAGVWALNQLSYVDGGKYLSRSEFQRGTKKIATPVGWVYYRNGYNSNTDKVELTLTQALFAIKYRKRTEPLDGIYSILGLLPYGKEIKVRYRIKKCDCEDKKNCEHEEVNNNPQDALYEVMKVAMVNGYAEPLSWLGISNPKQGLCWMPEIYENGSTSIVGSIGKMSSIDKNINDGKTYQWIFSTNQGLGFSSWKMPHYIIYKDNPQSIHKLESGFEIEGGLYRKELEVKPRDAESEPIKVSLLGTHESLEKAKERNILVVFYKEWFRTNKLLALLVKETEQKDIYHRLGLVELADSERIKYESWVTNFKKKTIIGLDSQQYQTQTQIPPK